LVQNALDEVQFNATSPYTGARALTWSFNDNAAGNANYSNSLMTNVDATFGPQITALVGQPVDDGTVELAGTGLTAGDTINLYVDGNTNTIVGTGTVSGGDTFDITTTATFDDGLHTFVVQETNNTNPNIPKSQPFTVTIADHSSLSVAISGTAKEGQILTATPTLDVDSDDTGASVSYQWQNSTDGSSWSNISGATSSTYALGEGDENKFAACMRRSLTTPVSS
jgi:hypothetical protein